MPIGTKLSGDRSDMFVENMKEQYQAELGAVCENLSTFSS